MRQRTTLLVAASFATMLMASSAYAQGGKPGSEAADGAETNRGQIGDIVVTAQKYAESLQSVPISAAAFTADDLAKQDIADPESLAEMVPNLSIGDGTGRGRSGAQIAIRGVGEARVSPVLDPGVAIYIDDIYFGRPQTAFLRMLDTERVEVLRGPQGTLFGKNAAGGAIRYILQRPTFDAAKGYAEITTGSRERIDARGAVNLPFSDNFAIRAAVGSLNQKGYLRRESDGVRLGNEKSLTGSFKSRWVPSSAVEINLGVDYFYSDTDNGAQKLIDYYRYNNTTDTPNPPATITTNPNVTASPNTVARWNQYWGNTPLRYAPRITPSLLTTAGGDEVSRNQSESIGVSLDIKVDLGGLGELRSISGYRKLTQTSSSDPDEVSPARTFLGGKLEDGSEFWSQELNLVGSYFDDRLKLTSGAFYSEERPYRFDIDNADVRNRFGFENRRSYQEQTTKSLGLFTQGTLSATDRLALTAGVRYTRDDKQFKVHETVAWNFDLHELARQYGRPLLVPTVVTLNGASCNTATGATCLSVPEISGGRVFEAWTPRFAVEYEVADRVMLYGSASRGFKAGGTNDTVFDITIPFNPETIWSFEGGVRSDLFNRRVRFNATYFYSIYKSKQITVSNAPECNNRCTSNVGDAIIQGVELETRAILFSGFSVFGNAGYTDAKWDKISNTTAGVTLHSPFARTPKWSAVAGFNYDRDVGEDLTLELSGSYSYKSEQQSSPQDSTTLTIPAYDLVSARVGVRARNGWSLSLFCSNCLDKRYITGGAAFAGGTDNTIFNYKPNSGVANPNVIGPPGISYVNVGEPRNWGLQLRKSF